MSQEHARSPEIGSEYRGTCMDDLITWVINISLLLKDSIPLKMSHLYSLLGNLFEEIKLDSCGGL